MKLIESKDISQLQSNFPKEAGDTLLDVHIESFSCIYSMTLNR